MMLQVRESSRAGKSRMPAGKFVRPRLKKTSGTTRLGAAGASRGVRRRATTTTVSVIVCTYNRCESLRQTLDALARQVMRSSGTVELLVVDNNSHDATKAVVKDASRRIDRKSTRLNSSH